jgi:excisionase family DNA binding protein
MATQLKDSHVLIEEGYKPRIAGRRITVHHIAEYYDHYGWSPAKIAEQFRLTLAQIHAALAYYYDHKSEIDLEIEEGLKPSEGAIDGQALLDGTLSLIMTPSEVAAEYDISESSVYQAVRRGRLRSRKSGKAVLVHRSDAEELWGHKRDKTE